MAGDCTDGPLYDAKRGLCRRHYMWLHWRGQLPPLPTLDELLVKWRKVTDSGCWEWRGAIGSHGYGSYGGKYVHRISLERAKGPIPDGLHVDHLCRNRACFNPDHLEAVPPIVNVRRGAGAHVIHTGNCHRGHPQTPENTYGPFMDRRGHARYHCRPCKLELMRKAWAVRND
jgi:hypothetical protein